MCMCVFVCVWLICDVCVMGVCVCVMGVCVCDVCVFVMGVCVCVMGVCVYAVWGSMDRLMRHTTKCNHLVLESIFVTSR